MKRSPLPVLFAVWREAARHPRNDDLLDVGGAFHNLQRLGIAIEAFGRILGGESVRPEYLHALIRRVHCSLGGAKLGNRGLVLVRLALILPTPPPRSQQHKSS